MAGGFGRVQCGGPLHSLHPRDAHGQEEPPTLIKADAWGRRLDRLVTSPGWRGQKVVSAREGLIAIPYEARQGAASRVVQAAKLYLYGASSGLFNCPLAMTDGATRLAQALGCVAPAFRARRAWFWGFRGQGRGGSSHWPAPAPLLCPPKPDLLASPARTQALCAPAAGPSTRSWPRRTGT